MRDKIDSDMWQIQDEEHKTSSREDTEKRDFDAES
jgi:hypothetical protein